MSSFVDSSGSRPTSVDPSGDHGPIAAEHVAVHPREWLEHFSTLSPRYRILEFTPQEMSALLDPQLKIPRRFHRSPPSGEEEDIGYTGESTSSEESWASAPSQPPSPPPALLCCVLPLGDDEEDEEEANGEAEVDSKLLETIAKALRDLGGAVVPKVDWKVPKDARWMALNKSLKCQSVADILLLIRHSNRVDESVEKAVSIGMTSHSLVLREWEDTFIPENEFRCFVMNGRLVCMSQRDTEQAYSSIVSCRERIIDELFAFFRLQIQRVFTQLPNYVVDLVRNQYGTFLMDFNVFGVDPGLVTYEELREMAEELAISSPNSYPYFRYATEGTVARPHPEYQCPLPIPLEIITHLTPPYPN